MSDPALPKNREELGHKDETFGMSRWIFKLMRKHFSSRDLD